MPKLKSHSASQKRIARVTGTGLLTVRHMGVAHRARFKSKRAKRNKAHNLTLTGGWLKKLKRLI